MPVIAVDDRGGSDNSGRARGGRRGDDPANHDRNDDRGIRNGADDGSNHEVGDDNDENRRRGRGK